MTGLTRLPLFSGESLDDLAEPSEQGYEVLKIRRPDVPSIILRRWACEQVGDRHAKRSCEAKKYED
jgi:hypothetical protein